MNRTKKLFMTLLPVVVLGLGTTAQAQETPPSDTPPPSPPPAVHHSSSSGDGAGLGIGGTIPLSGLGSFPAANVVYDMAAFHIEGLLAFTSDAPGAPGGDRNNSWLFGAGGWFHLHRGASSDLSVGGVVAINYTSQGPVSDTITVLEPGIYARAFATPNFAIFFRGGLAIALGNDNGAEYAFGAQPLLVGGFTYFLR
jgi:hypothetical protein